MDYTHQPVLAEETMAALRPERGGVFLDGTVGLGGHSLLLLERAAAAGKPVRLLCLDQDGEAIEAAKARIGEKAEFYRGNFADLEEVVRQAGVGGLDGILLDLGVSSYQLDAAERGFSFQADGPLDMRMDPRQEISAADLVAGWDERRLADLFWNYGEERHSRRIAKHIVEERQKQPFETTLQLAEAVRRCYPAAARFGRIHPATKVFQALRLETNQELEVLREGLEAAKRCMAPGGVLAVISFHSLEDRLVKQAFQAWTAEGGWRPGAKKPAVAGAAEQRENRRSRSAKLRAIEKTADF